MSSSVSSTMQPGSRTEPPLPLDAVLAAARDGEITRALDALNESLAFARERVPSEVWSRAIATCRAHPLRDFLHRDPFTFRCYAKPRGYAGDATALDYVLRAREPRVRANDPVAAIHHYTTHGRLAEGIAFRRDEVARVADALALQRPEPIRILAAGCGHLREVDRMQSIDSGRIREIVAFDMDAENVKAVRNDYGNRPVTAVHGSLQRLVSGDGTYADMDLVYCCGLFETLPQASALGLVEGLFRMVRRGGTLVIANFLSGMREAGYADAFMDWRMVYRSQAEMFGLVRALTTDSVSGWTYSESPRSSVGLVCLQKRQGS